MKPGELDIIRDALLALSRAYRTRLSAELSRILGEDAQLVFDEEMQLFAVWLEDETDIIGAGPTEFLALSEAISTARGWESA